ncbi:MAG: hypothetical protein EXS00_01280 [Phycisphaerales bacterium]|nr:hypothetical protein [Phycisphaerales bacterium]
MIAESILTAPVALVAMLVLLMAILLAVPLALWSRRAARTGSGAGEEFCGSRGARESDSAPDPWVEAGRRVRVPARPEEGEDRS